MIELLGLLGGGLLRLLPELLGLVKAKQSNGHDLELAKLQLAADQTKGDQQLSLFRAQGETTVSTAELTAMSEATKAQAIATGIRWVDAISAAVRPILTYYWCIGLYGAAKTLGVIVAFRSGASLDAFAPLLVSEFDRSVIASLISFWFVDRALRRMP